MKTPANPIFRVKLVSCCIEKFQLLIIITIEKLLIVVYNTIEKFL